MNTAGAIGINLVSAAIGGLLALAWRLWRRRRRLKIFRSFWYPFVEGRSTIVTGMLSPQILTETFPEKLPSPRREMVMELLPMLQEHIAAQELSGLMGGGDRQAIERVQSGLARAGMPANLPERDGSSIGEHVTENLILVGGPDVNPATKTFMDQVGCTLVITRDRNNRNVVKDLLHNQEWGVVAEPGGGLRDYGVIIRARNPNDPTRTILILAGAHGFGSLAAAEVCFSVETLMAEHARNHPEGFECLVHYQYGGSSGAAPRSSLVSVPRKIGRG